MKTFCRLAFSSVMQLPMLGAVMVHRADLRSRRALAQPSGPPLNESAAAPEACVGTGYVCDAYKDGDTTYCQKWDPDSICVAGTCVAPASCFQDLDQSLSNSSILQALYLTSPHGQQSKAGRYNLVGRATPIVGKAPNGHPFWKLTDADYWIYSSPDGYWMVGGIADYNGNFTRRSGFILCPVPHKGLAPNEVDCVWQYTDGHRWKSDRDLTLTAVPKPKVPQHLVVKSPNTKQSISGRYDLISTSPAQLVNGQPLWEHLNTDHWLYSTTNGYWMIGGVDDRDRKFQRGLGFVTCPSPHGGLTPDRMHCDWKRVNGTTWIPDAAISVSDPEAAKPTATPTPLPVAPGAPSREPSDASLTAEEESNVTINIGGDMNVDPDLMPAATWVPANATRATSERSS